MTTPDDICKSLSDKASTLIPEHFPNAVKAGQGWKMGDLDGDKGQSCGIFRGQRGIYLAKDAATDETVNILGLLHRKWGTSWVETFAQAKKICGLTDVAAVVPKPKPQRPKLKPIAMRGTPPYEYLKSRGINEQTMKRYQCTRMTRDLLPPSGQNRWNEEYVSFPFFDTYGDLVMWKWLGLERQEGKKEIGSTTPQYSTLWGWHTVDKNARDLIICEGEVDCLSIAQMSNIAVVSMPTGASNFDWINNDFERLQLFEKIYIISDMDQAGENAAHRIAKRLGFPRSFRVSLPEPYKDANEYLQSGETGKKPFDEVLADAKTYDPPRLSSAANMRSGLLEEIDRFRLEGASNNFLWPDLPFRYRRGEMTVITGYPHHGKSQFMYQSLLHEMSENDRRVCIASFEIPSSNMLFQFIWMLIGKVPTEEDVDKYCGIFSDRLWFIEGSEDGTQSWDSLSQDFLYANRRFGCDMFVVDALMHLTKKGDAEGTDRVAKSSAKFSIDNDSSVLLVAHADAKKAGGGKVPDIEDILGGQGIGGAAHNVISIWRNREKERRIEEGDDSRNSEADGKFYCSKQRSTGKTIFRDIWFNANARVFSLTEVIRSFG